MTDKAPLVIAVFCDPCEQPVWRMAAEALTAALGRTVAITFVDQARDLSQQAADAAAASLLPSAWHPDQPWQAVAEEWRALCQAWQDAGARPHFLCTIFRHLSPERAAGGTLERVRRLNLLAATLSQETGIDIIDLDRVLAHVGGRVIGADACLGSPQAQHLASGTIAKTFLEYVFDAELPDDAAQAAAAERLAAYRAEAQALPAVPAAARQQAEDRRSQAMMRRIVRPPVMLDDRETAGLLRDLSHRRISVRHAIQMLTGKVATRLRARLR